MRAALRRAGTALFVLWLVAVVVLAAGRHTPYPVYSIAHQAVVAGAAVLTVVGTVRLARHGYELLRERRSVGSEQN